MAKTYRDVAIEQMIATVEEAMSRVIDWWGELPMPMNEAIDASGAASCCLLRRMSPVLAQSGLSAMSADLSAFGAKRTCRDRRWCIDRSRMTPSDLREHSLDLPIGLRYHSSIA
jgi:hypothetical protein